MVGDDVDVLIAGGIIGMRFVDIVGGGGDGVPAERRFCFFEGPVAVVVGLPVDGDPTGGYACWLPLIQFH